MQALRERLATLSRGEVVGLIIVIVVTIGGAGFWYLRSLPKPVPIAAVGPGVGSLASGAFESGARAIDALEHAGGPRKGADLASLNLAAPLTDGQQLLIPSPRDARGEEEAPVDGTSDKININTADASELEELPGIGEVLAESIIDHRDEHGPFSKPEDLLDVSGIGDATLAEFADEVTV
jgi:competence protein ComEA